MLNKLKDKFYIIKYYFGIIKDFSKLNRYVILSSIFCSRVEQLLNSNLQDDVILNNIKMSYSNFKVDYDLDDIVSGVSFNNKFER